jgi:hypothetical protein
MPAAFTQVSDIQSPTDYIQKIYEDALFVAREQNLMTSLVTNYSGQGIAPRISSEYSATSISAINDDDDLTSQSFKPTVLSTLTPSEVGAQYLITDQRLESDPFGVQQAAALELGAAIGCAPLLNKHVATVFAITVAGLIAAMPAAGADFGIANLGKGGLILWPLFGATNQLLGGLAFLVVLFWMRRRNMPVWFVAVPAAFMLVLPAIAMISQLFVGDAAWLTGKNPNLLLSSIGIITLALEAWILIEAAKAWPKAKGVLEQPA